MAVVIKAEDDFGFEAEEDAILIEAPIKEGSAYVYNKPMNLNELVPYRTGTIVNMDAAHGVNMKYAVMAFDQGTGLEEHRAPGDALVSGLEGKGIIGYEGKEYPLEAGESFCFAANGRHYVKAVDGPFRMSLLLLLK